MRSGKFLTICLLLCLSPLVLRAEEAGPAVPAAATDEAAADAALQEPAPPPEPGAPKPKWLEGAGKDLSEALKAQQGGNEKEAEKLFRSALKALARKSDQKTLLGLKSEIEALFARTEEQFLRSGPADGSLEGLEVTDQELESAPASGVPRPARERAYVIPVDPDDPLVQKYIAIYTTGPRRVKMQEALDRMSLYRPMIQRLIKEAGLPKELIYLAMAESEFKNTATSWAGAVGIWQFMSSTGRHYSLKVNYWVDERRDPEKATRAALRHLRDLHDWFDDWHLALAAYNRGIYGVQRDMQFTRSADFSSLAKRDALPKETEHYVPKFMACVLIGDDPEAYGFRVNQLTLPAVDEVLLERPLDLKVAAQCAGVSEQDLRELNPVLRLWCTPKTDGPFTFRIPAGKKESFMEALSKVKDWTPAADVVKYKVKKGDFLGRIAAKFKTTAKAIQKENRIPNAKRLRPGQVLIIRPGKKYLSQDE